MMVGTVQAIVFILEKRAPRAPESRRPKARFTQGEARRYRLRFTKLGTAAFLSHLDLLRALPRIFRRLDLPLFYSQGFHPKPDLTFGPALSLGVASLHEYVDVKIAGDLALEGLGAALTAHAPEGIEIDAVVRLQPQDASIAKLLGEGARARYVVAVPRAALGDLGLHDVDGLRREIEGQLEGGSLVVMRSIDGALAKKIDVRDHLERIAIDPPAEHGIDLLRRAGVIGDVVPIEVRVRLAASGGVKIGEVVEALLGKEAPFRAVRAGLWATHDGRAIDPVDVSRLRETMGARQGIASGRRDDASDGARGGASTRPCGALVASS